MEGGRPTGGSLSLGNRSLRRSVSTRAVQSIETVHTLLASAKSAEVGSGGRDNIVVELEDDTAQWAAVGSDLEEDVGHGV